MVLQPWSSASSRHGRFSLVLRGGAHGRLPQARRHRSAVSLCALVACQYHCLGGAQGRAWVFPCPVPMLAAGQLRSAAVLVRLLPGKRVSFLRLRLAGRLFDSLCVLLYPIWCVAVPTCCVCCCCSTQQRSLLRSPLERVPVQISAPARLMCACCNWVGRLGLVQLLQLFVLHLCVCRS
jgi:hypothetical protein